MSLSSSRGAGFARIWIRLKPFALSLSKGCFLFDNREVQGFDRLSPNGFVIRSLLLFLAMLLLPSLAQAQNITPELVAEGPATPGGEVELAIHMRPAAGWHGYWLNPGDAGLPMDVQWKLPAGFSAEPLRYPVPTRLTVAGLMNYVYERDYALLVRLKVPAAACQRVKLRADG